MSPSERKKVVVIEDDYDDLTRRYGSIARSHDVHVVFLGILLKYHANELQRSGFDKIYGKRFGEWEDSLNDADVYFCDGLNGGYAWYLERVGKDRGYLVSGNLWNMKEARANGFQIPNQDLESIVERSRR
jgi:hypothetical protein